MGVKTTSTSVAAPGTDLAHALGPLSAEAPASSGTRRRPRALALPPPRPVVLVVDDAPAIRSALRRWLDRKFGLAVCSAENLAAARALCANERISGAVVDYDLPDGCGADLVRDAGLRACGPTVIFTGHVRDDVARAIEERGFDIAFKPWSGDDAHAFGARVLAHAARASLAIVTTCEALERERELAGDELELACHVALGGSVSSYAQGLGVSDGTAKRTRGALLEKTGRASLEELSAAVRALARERLARGDR